MECKNCQTDLSDQAEYCRACGGKVIRERMTFKAMMSEFFAIAFGWDNRYFTTVRALLVNPGKLFREYIGGTRKKYVNPFAFFAIGVAIALLVFNHFAEEYVDMSNKLSDGQFSVFDQMVADQMAESESQVAGVEVDSLKTIPLDVEKLKEQQQEINTKIQKAVLRYFNLFSFALLPFYALLAFWVFGKPYNYGEHLVINGYIQGLLFYFTIFFFLISMVSHPSVYFVSILIMMLYYSYAYASLCGHNIWQVIVRLAKFIGILLLTLVVFLLILFIFGQIVGYLSKAT